MLQRISPLLKLVLMAALVLLANDVALFRSGLYARWIEPASTAGSVMQTVLLIERNRDSRRRNILVLGNSQIGEGFSGPLADAASGRPDLHFINAAVPGTTPRVWNYLLREVDPAADRFAAIVMMVNYEPAADQEDRANYAPDISYLRPLLGLGDLSGFPASFPDAETRHRARRAILLPMQALHDDISAFLRAPWKRYRDAIRNRTGWLDAAVTYPGRDETLPELAIEPAKRLPVDWLSTPAPQKAQLEGYLRGLGEVATPERQAENSAYLKYWLGMIADRYQASGVPVIVFSVPRGPFHQTLAGVPAASGGVAALANAGRITALPGDSFVTLEQPRYFFDTLHMNRAGRESFSQLLAAHIAPLVH